jgi:hypothetical protein
VFGPEHLFFPYSVRPRVQAHRMAIQFYDVKSRQKVDIPESEVRKTKYEQQAKNGGVNTRYALRATYQGTNLTKFVKQSDWEALNAPIE